jgi:G6PDH family F420-dependent oxidoreductase
MVSIGYTIMSEQAGPKQLVENAIRAERAGFDFLAASDHYFPWLEEQGHAPYVWAVLGAVAQATETIELMTYVTCPTMRYHPAVVAQKAATVQLLSDGRFTLGLGAGENLNEHVAGKAWPPADIRHEMLSDALEIIVPLLAGETVTFRGVHLSTENAKIWDLPDVAPKIGIAVSGPRSCELAAAYGDAMIAVEPEADLVQQFEAAGGSGPRIGQVGLSYDRDAAAAKKRAHDQFRWFGGGWNVNAELPAPEHFASASQFVTEDDVAEQIPSGAEVAKHVAAVRKFVDAGFSHVAVVQIGGDAQDPFFDWAEAELLPELRKLDDGQ